jgi:hypothetical protein
MTELDVTVLPPCMTGHFPVFEFSMEVFYALKIHDKDSHLPERVTLAKCQTFGMCFPVDQYSKS